jgi:hypothetical protein
VHGGGFNLGVVMLLPDIGTLRGLRGGPAAAAAGVVALWADITGPRF